MTAAMAWARAAGRAAASMRTAGGLAGKAAKPKGTPTVRLNAFRSSEGGGHRSTLLGEGRTAGKALVPRHRLRLSPAACNVSRSAFALYRNLMMMDCFYLYDSEGKR